MITYPSTPSSGQHHHLRETRNDSPDKTFDAMYWITVIDDQVEVNEMEAAHRMTRLQQPDVNHCHTGSRFRDSRVCIKQSNLPEQRHSNLQIDHIAFVVGGPIIICLSRGDAVQTVEFVHQLQIA